MPAWENKDRQQVAHPTAPSRILSEHDQLWLLATLQQVNRLS